LKPVLSMMRFREELTGSYPPFVKKGNLFEKYKY
jgi:hypothetical protein